MKRVALFLLLWIAAVTVFASGLPDGFRGVKWGTEVSETPGLALKSTDGDSQYYERSSDKLSIGDAQLDRILYGFYKGKFANVQLEFSGSDNHGKIYETFVQAYGIPMMPNWASGNKYWGVNHPVTTIMMLPDRGPRKSGALMYSTVLQKQQQAEASQKARDAKKDL